MREPYIFRWPGKIPSGTTCNEIMCNIDMLPTFAKLAGTVPPQDRVIDGRDFSSLMFNPKAGPVRDTQLYYGGRLVGETKLLAIRQGDWKLFLNTPSDQQKDKKAKKVDDKNTPPVLYNLVDDIGETKDVSAEHPDIVSRLLKEATERDAEIQEHKRPVGKAGGMINP